MKKTEITQDDIRTLVIRPLVLKRDNYSCACCGITHKARVYLNSRKHYVMCDEFTEAWAKEQGKKVFTVYLNVVNTSSFEFSDKTSDYLTLCPKHSQMHSLRMINEFKSKLKAEMKATKNKRPDDFDFYRSTVLGNLIKDIKQLTNHKITPNEADSLINNIISNL